MALDMMLGKLGLLSFSRRTRTQDALYRHRISIAKDVRSYSSDSSDRGDSTDVNTGSPSPTPASLDTSPEPEPIDVNLTGSLSTTNISTETFDQLQRVCSTSSSDNTSSSREDLLFNRPNRYQRLDDLELKLRWPEGPPRANFTYDPLNLATSSIRLIKVIPVNSDLIHCHIANASTESEYVCLSYTWGSQDDMHKIKLNGKNFKVGRNLWDFLDIVRSKYITESFWIDAICIDQSNTADRNHQVQQMGNLYAGARLVLLWIGVNLVYTLRCFLWMSRQERGDSDFEWHSQLWDSFLGICNNEYWTRAWVVQEIRLARRIEVLSGPDTVSWSTFSRLWHEATLSERLSIPRRRLLEESHAASFQETPKGDRSYVLKPLRDLLKVHGLKQCSDLRDRVYSLLSLASEGRYLPVDYDIPRLELFFRTLALCGDSTPEREQNLDATYKIVAEVLGIHLSIYRQSQSGTRGTSFGPMHFPYVLRTISINQPYVKIPIEADNLLWMKTPQDRATGQQWHSNPNGMDSLPAYTQAKIELVCVLACELDGNIHQPEDLGILLFLRPSSLKDIWECSAIQYPIQTPIRTFHDCETEVFDGIKDPGITLRRYGDRDWQLVFSRFAFACCIGSELWFQWGQSMFKYYTFAAEPWNLKVPASGGSVPTTAPPATSKRKGSLFSIPERKLNRKRGESANQD